jgi:MscS family membrane protein
MTPETTTSRRLMLKPLYVPVIAILLVGGGVLAWRFWGLTLPHGDWIGRVLLTLLWLSVAVFSVRLVRAVLRAVRNDSQPGRMVNRETYPIFANLSLVVLILLFSWLVFASWDIDMTALAASAGVVGIAVGFAAKDTLANLFSGLFILIDKPYSIGDYLLIDGNIQGVVTDIGIRSTRLLTRQDCELVIPNAVMGNTKIFNENAGLYENHQTRIKLSLRAEDNTEAVRGALVAVAKEHEGVDLMPEPKIITTAVTYDKAEVEILFWVENPWDRECIVDALLQRMHRVLNAER